jgi:glyoxylate/hydroxypyruvate reductase A
MSDDSRFHIHLLNSADIAAYSVPPIPLREALRSLSLDHKTDFVITENHDFSEVTPDMVKADAIVGYHLPKARIQELKNLKWIHLISAGVDHLTPLDWLPPHVRLTNNSGVHVELAGQYACGALLMLNFGIPGHATQQRLGGWNRTYNTSVVGKTVVIVGVGSIGGSAAGWAKKLGLKVIGVRRSSEPHPSVDRMVGPQDLRQVLPEADFVMVTAALTPETRGLVGAAELAAMRPGAGLVNMARAAIVDYAALVEQLNSGRISGAIVDVCNIEPLPPDDPLRSVKNILITPHISSDPADYKTPTVALVVDNITRILSGRDLVCQVDPLRGY